MNLKPLSNIQPNQASVKQEWTKPQVEVIGIGEKTLGAHSLHGTDVSFSS